MEFSSERIQAIKQKLKPAAAVVMCGMALAALIKPVTADNPQATVSGVVFEDKNGNGAQDENEQGIPGVSVSDGKTIVLTDGSGAYALVTNPDRRATDMVFVTVPGGFSVKANENMTPQFYQNLGNLKDGEMRTQSFGLLRTPETSNPNFSFVNIADVHVEAGTTNNRERFTEQLGELNSLSGSPAFIAVSGDLTNRATDAEFQDYTASTATSKLPVYSSVGNHDIAPGKDYATRIDRYRQYVGPEWYSYDYGNRHFVVLENILGFKEEDQYEWLQSDLAQNAKDKEVIVIVHKPMNNPQTPVPDYTQKFIDLLGEYNTQLVLMGHTHVNDVAIDTIQGAKHIVTNSSSYTIDQTPNGFRVVKFKGGKEENPFKMYGVDKSVTLVSPAPGSETAQGSVPILVNAYNTTSNIEEVQYRVDGGSWKKLDKSSAFTWFAEWDARKADIGEHSIEVQVTDDAGNVWNEEGNIKILKENPVAVPVQGAEWTMFHGNAQHTGQAGDEVNPNLALAWSYRTPGTILTSSPAIVDGQVYIGTRDEDDAKHNSVIGLDLKTGQKNWELKTDAQIQSSPAVSDGIVYASSIRGTLYAIDANSGHVIWEKTVAKEEVQRAWMYYSPTVENGKVYQAYSTGQGGALMALDAKTGGEIWTRPLAGGWISESSAIVKDGKVYVGGDGGWLIALDAENGEELWRKQPAGWNWMHSMPSIADGRVYMGYGGGIIVALDAETGNEVWRYQSTESSYIAGLTTGSSPAVADGTVFMGFPDGNVAALDAATGNKLWSYRTGGGIISSATISGDTVYIGSNDGNVYGLDRSSGEVKWNHKIGAWVASTPAISGNTLVVGAFDGNVYAFTEKK